MGGSQPGFEFALCFLDGIQVGIVRREVTEFGTDYFQSLSKHAVPLDRRAVGALASSSMALDMYVWLAQWLHRVPAGKGQLVTWVNLDEQFGQGYGRMVDFRRAFLETLKQVVAVYPEAKLDVDERGVTLWTSSPPISSRVVSVPALPTGPSYPQLARE